LAAVTAIKPETPVAPRISTVSPGRRRARQDMASQAASPALPSAAAMSSATLSGTGKANRGSISVRSAIEPKRPTGALTLK
jgi:hypothetical protein